MGLLVLCLWVASTLRPAVAAQSKRSGPSRPNIVMVIADDLGYGDVGAYGAPSIATPRIDAMAAEGLLSEAFYTCVSCSPTRAAVMTGSYPARVNVISPQGSWSDLGMAPSEVTIAEMLRGAGYATGHFGKWHLGDSPDQLPEAQGFGDVLTSPWGLPARPNTLLDGDGLVVTDGDPFGWTPMFVDRTLAFIDQSVLDGTPFLAVLSHITPHYPATPSADFVGVSADGREYGDSVEEIDSSVGRILDRLDALGVGNDTLVMFFSDNGPALQRGAYQAGSAGSLRGQKGQTFEGGVRSPFVARWPARIPAGVRSGALMHVVDLFDTFAALAGVTLPAGLPPRDGVDVSSVLSGGAGDPARYVHHFRGNGLESVRQGRWKLYRDELFNLQSDPSETTNVAAQNPIAFQILSAARSAKEADVLGNVRARSLTLRRSPQWRGNSGLGIGVGNGAVWRDRLSTSTPWDITDLDAAVDFDIVPTNSRPTEQLPPSAVRLPAPSASIRMTRTGVDLGVVGGNAVFSMEFWFRSLTDSPATNLMLFEAGGGDHGMSITIGDAGRIGDDGTVGQRDDVVVRIGGSLSPNPAGLVFDLPSGPRGWANEFVHLVVTFDEDQMARAWLNGFEVASQAAPAVNAGLRGTWALFGRDGQIGGAGGSGRLPFSATGFAGEIAMVRAYDRALSRKEVEVALCRHVAYTYCTPKPDASGTRLRFDLVGDFRPGSQDLQIELLGAPSGTLGVLLYARDQVRLPAVSAPSSGSLCVARRLALDARPFTVGGASGPGGGLFGTLGGVAFEPEPGSTWNFQVWARSGANLRFSNALHVLFCP